jgi:hypothetical protein
MLGLLCALLWVGARIPTYAYFMIPEEFTEVEIKERMVEECYDFGLNVTRQCLIEFSGPHPITLLHAWKRSDDVSDYYALEVMRLRVRYLITVEIPVREEPEKKYLYSVKILNEESPSGSHWFQPPDDILEKAMNAVKAEYASAELTNVAVFKTVMNVNLYAQMLVCVTVDAERMLFDVALERAYGSKEDKVTGVKRIY